MFCTFLNMFFQRCHQPYWYIQVCLELGPLEGPETACVQHRATTLMPKACCLHQILGEREGTILAAAGPRRHILSISRSWGKASTANHGAGRSTTRGHQTDAPSCLQQVCHVFTVLASSIMPVCHKFGQLPIEELLAGLK